MGPVLGRSSYIDDIAHGAPTWDQLCDDLNALLFRLRYWNISVSLPKSEFGKLAIPYLSHEISAEGIRATPKIAKSVQGLPSLPKSEFGKLAIPYLSHEISAEGIRATPKIAKSVQGLPFPTLKGVQSFLGSLNYYNKFVEDLPVVAVSLYELTEEQVRSGRDIERAKEAFKILKRKIVSTPSRRHPDRTKQFIIIPHANPWAAFAVLGQMHGGVIQPVGFTGRIPNEFELRYHIAEKEVLAIRRVLELFRPLSNGSESSGIIYTRYSVLKWLLNSNSIEGRCLKWALEQSRMSLEIRRVQRDADGLAAILGAGITPREHLDAVVEDLIPAKGRIKKPPAVSMEMLESDYQGVVLSFKCAAKTSTRVGSCGCVLWQLPGWEVLDARGFMLGDVTVNDAEYHGMLNGLKMASERGVEDFGDSMIVIQQVQGLINCNQPNLQHRLAEYEVIRKKFKTVQLVHVKRLYNQAADYLTSKNLTLGMSWQVRTLRSSCTCNSYPG
ncbi:unnamed protein product [Phytophthora fragariaefolia]|uniref:Unnamed protein product n=1 Tax=Phytophthora fragariaefolia TaxID=1490495 RepID=A0A9W6Y1N0_9STRA|nr:unnamed protein product [Phytophthora fragariaefolia]